MFKPIFIGTSQDTLVIIEWRINKERESERGEI